MYIHYLVRLCVCVSCVPGVVCVPWCCVFLAFCVRVTFGVIVYVCVLCVYCMCTYVCVCVCVLGSRQLVSVCVCVPLWVTFLTFRCVPLSLLGISRGFAVVVCCCVVLCSSLFALAVSQSRPIHISFWDRSLVQRGSKSLFSSVPTCSHAPRSTHQPVPVGVVSFFAFGCLYRPLLILAVGRDQNGPCRSRATISIRPGSVP